MKYIERKISKVDDPRLVENAPYYQVMLDAYNSVMGNIANANASVNEAISIAREVKDSFEEYRGRYNITPNTENVTVLETRNRVMSDDVTIFAVPRWETSNESGTTIYIGDNNAV